MLAVTVQILALQISHPDTPGVDQSPTYRYGAISQSCHAHANVYTFIYR